jgi:type VI secretion system secreted protein VgrG
MSTTFQQTNLAVQITTPLGANQLLVRSYSGSETISGLFHYQVSLISENAQLSFNSIVGKPVTLQIGQSSGDMHYVNGIVGNFEQLGQDQRFVHYKADIYPWLWLLTMNVDCQIFQNMSTPDIIKQVFSDLGFSDFKESLTRTYAPREFCVQYRESAFTFVSRLMEEEGIFYFFQHTSASHTMVLADDSSAWLACDGLTSARYSDRTDSYGEDDLVTECSWRQCVTPGQFKTDDFNSLTPDSDLLATASSADTSRSIYQYPGLYTKQSDGESIANIRLAALELPMNSLHGTSTCRSFYAGAKFALTGHYNNNCNTEYIVREVAVRGDQQTYRNTFEAFPAAATFRPPQVTPRPIISGCQTALVVGKSGEEIWTDVHGCVVLKFYWDQSAPKDETSSCFVRVASPWAGKQWGGMFLPRIGQEVVVTFLEGNPDRPLITGSVYNASQTVPYPLPASQTKSTIKSNSSKGGNGFNELRFEDKAGSEELFIQAQKDMNVTVLNDHSMTVTKDESLAIKGKRTMTVTGDESHTNKADYTSKTSGNYTLTVSGNLSIKASGSVSIEAGTSLSIKSGTSMSSEAGTALTDKAGTTLTNQAGTNLTNKAGENLANQAGTDLTNKAGANMTNEAGAELSNKGGASQTVDGGGMLTMKGGLIKLN